MRRWLLLLAVVPTLAVAAPVPRDSLADWGKAVDPAKDCTFERSGTKLKITVPGDKDPHHLSGELNAPMHAPRVLKEVEGDFQMEVSVAAFEVPENTEGGTARNIAFWGAGLLVWKDEKSYVRLERAMFRRKTEAFCYVGFELRKDGELVKFGMPNDGNLDPKKAARLRLNRKGNTFTAGVSEDDGKTWTELKPLDAELGNKVQAGIVAVNTAKADFVAKYDKYSLSELKDDNSEKK